MVWGGLREKSYGARTSGRSPWGEDTARRRPPRLPRGLHAAGGRYKVEISLFVRGLRGLREAAPEVNRPAASVRAIQSRDTTPRRLAVRSSRGRARGHDLQDDVVWCASCRSTAAAFAQLNHSPVRSSLPLFPLRGYKAIEYASRRDKIHAWQHAIKRWLRVVVTVSYHRR